MQGACRRRGSTFEASSLTRWLDIRSLLLIIPSDVVRTNQTVRKYVAALNSEMSM